MMYLDSGKITALAREQGTLAANHIFVTNIYVNCACYFPHLDLCLSKSKMRASVLTSVAQFDGYCPAKQKVTNQGT